MMHLIDNPSEIENNAALWVIKTTHRELTVTEEQDFQAWINQSEYHLAAYYKARQLWSLTASLPVKVSETKVEAIAIPKAISVKKTTNNTAWYALASMIIFCVLSVSIWHYHAQEIPDYQASTGELLRVNLPDGSQVELDSGAQLSLAFNENYRQVNLLSGRAYFTVAPITQQELRPFRVLAQNGFIQALGTEFVVDDKSDQVEVSVYQHSVKISLLTGQSVTVKAGNSIQYQQYILPISSLQHNNSTAWRQGQIIFHQRTLSDVVSEINRYRSKPVILLAKQSDQRISGVFQVASIESGLTHLATSRHLSIYEVPFMTLMYW
nr:FecR domain-containing protein [Providencia heimbachae]